MVHGKRALGEITYVVNLCQVVRQIILLYQQMRSEEQEGRMVKACTGEAAVTVREP